MRKQILASVDDFLRERLRPDNPEKILQRHWSKAVLAAYYERKRGA